MAGGAVVPGRYSQKQHLTPEPATGSPFSPRADYEDHPCLPNFGGNTKSFDDCERRVTCSPF